MCGGHVNFEQVVAAMRTPSNERVYPRSLAPKWMHAPDILHGYRVDLSTLQATGSLLWLHNEFVNVWTHALGAVGFLLLAVYTWAELAASAWGDRLTLVIALLASVFCFASSAIYHLLLCVSPSMAALTYRMDLTGITVMICGWFVPGIYQAFYCYPAARHRYLMFILVQLGLGLLAAHHPRLRKPESAHIRVAILLAMSAFGLVPLLHWASIVPVVVRDLFVSQLARIFVWYGIGFVFYRFRLPERWAPGLFDTWGSSHQLWHLFILVGAVQSYLAMNGLRTYHAEQGCAEVLLLS